MSDQIANSNTIVGSQTRKNKHIIEPAMLDWWFNDIDSDIWLLITIKYEQCNYTIFRGELEL